MGGNAIKKFNIIPSRINRDEYNSVVDNVNLIINNIRNLSFEPTFFCDIKTFDSKDNFGDLDMLIGFNEHLNRNSFEDIINRAINGGRFPVIVNGPVSSLVYVLNEVDNESNEKYFQIDLNYVKESQFEIAYNYHGNGDLGNLLGRIFHNLGLKFGHDGLHYIHRNETYVVGEIVLSTDIEHILSFIGLDYPKNGFCFQSDKEIYDYVMSSPFFHPDFYDLELRNHSARVRDSKRPSYNAFTDYCTSDPCREKPLAGKDYYMVAIYHFNKVKEFNELIKKESERLMRKTVLDPVFISEITGLKDKDLGVAMKELKELYLSNDNSFSQNRELVVQYLINLGFLEPKKETKKQQQIIEDIVAKKFEKISHRV